MRVSVGDLTQTGGSSWSLHGAIDGPLPRCPIGPMCHSAYCLRWQEGVPTDLLHIILYRRATKRLVPSAETERHPCGDSKARRRS